MSKAGVYVKVKKMYLSGDNARQGKHSTTRTAILACGHARSKVHHSAKRARCALCTREAAFLTTNRVTPMKPERMARVITRLKNELARLRAAKAQETTP